MWLSVALRISGKTPPFHSPCLEKNICPRATRGVHTLDTWSRRSGSDSSKNTFMSSARTQWAIRINTSCRELPLTNAHPYVSEQACTCRKSVFNIHEMHEKIPNSTYISRHNMSISLRSRFHSVTALTRADSLSLERQDPHSAGDLWEPRIERKTELPDHS